MEFKAEFKTAILPVQNSIYVEIPYDVVCINNADRILIKLRSHEADSLATQLHLDLIKLATERMEMKQAEQ